MAITIKDVAKKAGVGVGTASRVLNNKPLVSERTRQRVLEAAQELNFFPDASAKRLKSGRTQVIALVVEEQLPEQIVANVFLSELLRGFHKAARAHNYHVLFEPFFPDDNTNNRHLRLVQENHVDGMVISGPRFDNKQLLELVQQGGPVVLHGRLPGSDVPFVDVDNREGARMATRHLLSLGHRQIGLITNAPLDYTAAMDRRAGYQEALLEFGLELDEALIQIGSFSAQSGYRAMQTLLALSPPPTAVFAASDDVAIGAMRAARDAGLQIPKSLAIVGFDDIPSAIHLHPRLTTVKVPAFELGRQAGILLIKFIEGEKMSNTQVLLNTELVIRDSCGAQSNLPGETSRTVSDAGLEKLSKPFVAGEERR